jgi:hypothetical protein
LVDIEQTRACQCNQDVGKQHLAVVAPEHLKNEAIHARLTTFGRPEPVVAPRKGVDETASLGGFFFGSREADIVLDGAGVRTTLSGLDMMDRLRRERPRVLLKLEALIGNTDEKKREAS